MICYLIERNDTHEWYCLNWFGYYGHTFGGKPFGIFPDWRNDWTRDANKAYKFKTIEEAEDFLKNVEFIHHVNHNDCVVTEHEFVNI